VRLRCEGMKFPHGSFIGGGCESWKVRTWNALILLIVLAILVFRLRCHSQTVAVSPVTGMPAGRWFSMVEGYNLL